MTINIFLWLLLLAALWSPAFLWIKIAIRDIPPVTMVTLRVGIAAIILYIILRLRGTSLEAIRQLWQQFLIMGLIAHAIPFVLFSWGELYVDSAIASILNGVTPFFTIVLAHFFTNDDRLTPAKILGGIVGSGGLLLLVFPELRNGVSATFWGLIGITAAAACYGVAIIYSRRHFQGLPQLVAPTAQLGMAALILIPCSLFLEQPLAMNFPSRESTAALVALILIPTVIAFVVYYHILEKTNASSLSTVTYIIPLFGAILGVTILNEQLQWSDYMGCSLILLGVFIVNGFFSRFTTG